MTKIRRMLLGAALILVGMAHAIQMDWVFDENATVREPVAVADNVAIGLFFGCGFSLYYTLPVDIPTDAPGLMMAFR